jgi:hypothetical protein
MKRRTDRGKHVAVTSEWGRDAFAVLADEEVSHGLTASFLSNASLRENAKLLKHIEAAERYLFKNSAAFADFISWLRLSKQEELKEDGMAAWEVGLAPHEVMTFRLLRANPSLQSLMLPFAGYVAGKRAKALALSSAGIVLLSIEDQNLWKEHPEQVFRVGRLAMRHWLDLTRQGLVLQPISSASLMVFDELNNVGAESAPLEYKALYKENAILLRDSFSLSVKSAPVWMYRFGKPEHEELRMSKRRRLAEFWK